MGGEILGSGIMGKTMQDELNEILKLDNQVCFPLYAAARLVVQAYRPLLGDLGLTYPQYLVMLVLWETDGASVGQIGEVLYLDSGTLTPLLKRLEKQGLVDRRRRVEDDRTVENWLTDEGKELREKAGGIPGELVCNADLDVERLLAETARIHDADVLAQMSAAGRGLMPAHAAEEMAVRVISAATSIDPTIG